MEDLHNLLLLRLSEKDMFIGICFDFFLFIKGGLNV